MPHFKDSENRLYWLDQDDDPAVWLPHCVPITEQEAGTLKLKPTYRDLRVAEYPDFREYLDGIVKGDQAQIAAYIAACQAVKDKYPKA